MSDVEGVKVWWAANGWKVSVLLNKTAENLLMCLRNFCVK